MGSKGPETGEPSLLAGPGAARIGGRGRAVPGRAHPANEPPKICQASADFAARLSTR
jgi:hypothetical protein